MAERKGEAPIHTQIFFSTKTPAASPSDEFILSRRGPVDLSPLVEKLPGRGECQSEQVTAKASDDSEVTVVAGQHHRHPPALQKTVFRRDKGLERAATSPCHQAA